MLELVLTRPEERRRLISAARGLQFLVLDELHTYRGRQGADVAMLVRRVRDACQSPDLQCIGTSATMASGGTIADQRPRWPEVATRLFGAEVTPDRVIGETLDRATTGERRRRGSPDSGCQPGRHRHSPTTSSRRSALASWIEDDVRPRRPKPSTGRVIRQTPARYAETPRPTVRDHRLHRRAMCRPPFDRHAARWLAGARCRDPYGRCSPSACTSSCQRATRSMSPSETKDSRYITSTVPGRGARQSRRFAVPVGVLPRMWAGLPRGLPQRGARRLRVFPCAA